MQYSTESLKIKKKNQFKKYSKYWELSAIRKISEILNRTTTIKRSLIAKYKYTYCIQLQKLIRILNIGVENRTKTNYPPNSTVQWASP